MNPSTLTLKIGKILVSEQNVTHWNHRIARRVATNPGNSSRVINKLMKDGVVKQVGSVPSEKRGAHRVLYSVTDTGVMILREMLAPYQISTAAVSS